MAPDFNITVIGVGNDFRSDDGIGPAVARYLAAMKLPNIHIVDQIGDGSDLINAWREAEVAFVIDCMQSGCESGTIRRFDVRHEDIPEEILPGLSTHAFNISATIRLAQSVGQLPPTLIVYGVEGKVFAVGDQMTPPVETAVSEVAERIVADITRLSACAAASEAEG